MIAITGTYSQPSLTITAPESAIGAGISRPGFDVKHETNLTSSQSHTHMRLYTLLPSWLSDLPRLAGLLGFLRLRER